MTEFGVAGDECIVGDHSGPCLFEVWERNETINVFRAEIAADGEVKATFRSKMTKPLTPPADSTTKSQGDTYMSTISGSQKRPREPTQRGTPDSTQDAGMSEALATAV